MKLKFLSIILIILVSIFVSGCISGDSSTTTPAPTTTLAPTTPAPTTTLAPTTPAPTTTLAPTTIPPTTIPPYYDTKDVNVSDDNGGFKVTVIKVGYFTHPKYHIVGPETTHFRVDLEIENLINAKRSIYPNINSYIVDDQNVRWPVYFVGSPTDISGEYDGLEVRQGYIVFEAINEDSSTHNYTIEKPTMNLPVKLKIEFVYP